MSSTQELDRIVTEALVEALGLDEDEVVDSALLGQDLGAESIDHLDILFQLQRSLTRDKHIGHDMPLRDSPFASFNDLNENPSLYLNEMGKLNHAGQKIVQKKMPYVDIDRVMVNEQGYFWINLTVVDVKNYVQWIVGQHPYQPKD